MSQRLNVPANSQRSWFVTFDELGSPEFFGVSDQAQAHAQHLIDEARSSKAPENLNICWGEFTAYQEAAYDASQNGLLSLVDTEVREFCVRLRNRIYAVQNLMTNFRTRELATWALERLVDSAKAKFHRSTNKEPMGEGQVLAWDVSEREWKKLDAELVRTHSDMFPLWHDLPPDVCSLCEGTGGCGLCPRCEGSGFVKKER